MSLCLNALHITISYGNAGTFGSQLLDYDGADATCSTRYKRRLAFKSLRHLITPLNV